MSTYKDWMVTAPGQHILVTAADNARDARRIARETYGVEKLPKGTHVERYYEDWWN